MLSHKKLLAASLISIALISTAPAFTCPEASQIEYNDNYGWVLNNAPEWDIIYHPYGPVADVPTFVEATYYNDIAGVDYMYAHHAICGYTITGSHFELRHTRRSTAPDPKTDANWKLEDEHLLFCGGDDVNSCNLP